MKKITRKQIEDHKLSPQQVKEKLRLLLKTTHNHARELSQLLASSSNVTTAKHARVVPCPCGGGKAHRLADGAEIHPDGTLSCMECGAPILAIQTDKEN